MAARIVGRLKSRQVANARPPRGKDWAVIPDGGNLYLQATRGKGGHVRRSWLFKYEIGGNRKQKLKAVRHEIGLGPLHTVSLAEARDKARTLRQQLLEGVDPIVERRKREQALIAERARTVTFKQVAEQYLDLHLDSFRNAKQRAQWASTLKTYAFPKLGHMTVADISPADVLRVIEPIWKDKRETASRVRQRIERILDYATAREYRTADNPASRITESLPKAKNGKGHHAALPFSELPGFMEALRGRETLPARALEFTILTAARTGEVIGARWAEFDIGARTWTVPGLRMKAGKAHKVPLSPRALEILQGLERFGDRVFAIGPIPMPYLLRALRPGITVHGFRSSFRDWAAEQTAYPNHVVEMALAHAIGDKVEAAYRRGDLFAKRVRLMDAWATFCSKPAPAAAGTQANVVTLRR
jgi:integrase